MIGRNVKIGEMILHIENAHGMGAGTISFTMAEAKEFIEPALRLLATSQDSTVVKQFTGTLAPFPREVR